MRQERGRRLRRLRTPRRRVVGVVATPLGVRLRVNLLLVPVAAVRAGLRRVLFTPVMLLGVITPVVTPRIRSLLLLLLNPLLLSRGRPDLREHRVVFAGFSRERHRRRRILNGGCGFLRPRTLRRLTRRPAVAHRQAADPHRQRVHPVGHPADPLSGHIHPVRRRVHPVTPTTTRDLSRRRIHRAHVGRWRRSERRRLRLLPRRPRELVEERVVVVHHLTERVGARGDWGDVGAVVEVRPTATEEVSEGRRLLDHERLLRLRRHVHGRHHPHHLCGTMGCDLGGRLLR